MNMRELLVGQNARLRNVVRFSNCTRHHQESVAEHSYFVAFYAYLMGLDLELEGEELSELVQAALVHDLEEAVSGDVLHSFKYSSKELTKALKKAGITAVASVIDPLGLKTQDCYDLKMLWAKAKDGPNGDIMKLADILSTIGYVCREIRAGNSSIKTECLGLRDTLFGLRSEYKRLRDYFDQTLDMLEEVGL